ncbi:hypothetical protein [Acidisoma silvae]|uniref:Uncharacterized protein n=1 Tax=Acidisoma silvae TaxID=2802396 RepID=A0A963YWU2_9PROT|nr:hypothetical protein [Acidisoma silvae]MCB8878441.1 hypothetical protein [Acidisoma silvae]
MSYRMEEPNYVQAWFKWEWFRLQFQFFAKVGAALFFVGGCVVYAFDPAAVPGFFELVYLIGALCAVAGVLVVVFGIIRAILRPKAIVPLPRDYR